ncbi:polysaccharide deacetylase family protein [Pseudoflavitalea rhizosphaerae]|uniref:polysaccharide deacetylase family protein n=1 Tax=Pseudoflavitalea rhizosphaerae TaxID=1884793 RepID=UPI000F8EEC98|nr:polysaccharide deacetylase family protein [Pseudoflavitalea rhizosphaerae]
MSILKIIELLIISFTYQQHTLRIVQHEVPVICYHNIRPLVSGQAPDYTISTEVFSRHIKMLHDSGYHSITPEQLYNYLTRGDSLPSHPVLISFDDSREEQYSIAPPILKQYGFKAVFFIMTVTINKPGYLTAEQIKILSDNGNCIALHTWDHPDMRKVSLEEWPLQIDQPKKLLQRITGKTVDYFAWPNGTWNEKSAGELSRHNIKAAFQLSGKLSGTYPLYTIRRLLVSGSWSGATLLSSIRSSFR